MIQLPGWALRLAASGLLPARWFAPPPPPESARAAREGALHIEIVSHCWRYAHFLRYQLSSLALFPPETARITMTVFYAEEDAQTRELLEAFGARDVPNVTWNWQVLPKTSLFRRGIGRNQAALATTADWIWFTDCDLLFREDCLDTLNERLQGRRDALLYPTEERCTPLLADSDPMLASAQVPDTVDIATEQFDTRRLDRATGPMQITHGDVARACGYCPTLRHYHTPADHFCKAYEDRAFRWLLGTQGAPVEVPGVYRIRHVSKGRYRDDVPADALRGKIRQWKDRAAGEQPDRSSR